MYNIWVTLVLVLISKFSSLTESCSTELVGPVSETVLYSKQDTAGFVMFGHAYRSKFSNFAESIIYGQSITSSCVFIIFICLCLGL